MLVINVRYNTSVFPSFAVCTRVLFFLLIAKMRGFKNHSYGIILKNYDEWDLNPFPTCLATYTDFEFAAALHRKAGLKPLNHCRRVLNC